MCSRITSTAATHVAASQLEAWEEATTTGCTIDGASGNWLVVEGGQQPVRYQDELEVLGEMWVVSALPLFGTSSVLPITLLKVSNNIGEGGLTRIMWKQRPGWSYTKVLQDWIWPALLLPPLLSKDPFKPMRRSRVGHLMISEHLQQCLLCDLYICQPHVPKRRSSLLDHLTLRFIMSFSTECGMFFIYRRCTPPGRLYGIIDRSISVDRGLYRPISIQEVFTFNF
jgi:hypothetical protein